MYTTARVAYIVDRADFVGAPVVEDAALLRATDDAEIVHDVLEDSDEPMPEMPRGPEHTMAIPRKPRPVEKDPRLSGDEIDVVRRRIKAFIQRSIDTNGGNINPDSLRGYLCDLKAEMLGSGSENARY